MYKAAGRSFLVNGGAANNITGNLIVNGGVGVYNQRADNTVAPLPGYDNGTLHRGEKGDYVRNTESGLGCQYYACLFNTSLAKRWPTFSRI